MSQRRRRGDNAYADTLKVDSSLLVADTTQKDSLPKDTTKIDSITLIPGKKKDPLSAPVVYEATDSIVFVEGGFAHLYGDGKVTYEKTELMAAIISMDMDSSTVFARGVTDSLGVIKGKPVFKDGETPYETNTIRYNFKSKRGLISNVVTQQGEGYVIGHDAKKGANDELYMRKGQYTTCDHHDHPHFYIQMSYGKVRPKKNVVTGPAHLVVEDVSLPLVVPFFFFPFSSSYSSGFLMPTYMDDSNRGFGLVNGGYYFAISDQMDLKLTEEIFTKGSWALGAEANYNRRYKYSGLFQANYQVTKTGDKNMPDYSVSKDFKIIWSHRQDAKASPNSTFSSSVNFTTSSYERSNVGNLYNAQAMTQNTKTSSVSYSRNFPDQHLSISGTANIAQTMKDSSISMTLPDLNIALSRIFPFKRKEAVGDEKWYEKISLSYTGRMTNSIQTKDTEIFKAGFDKWYHAMNHNVPISATFTLFNYFNVVPQFTYTERWYTRKIMKEYDMDKKQLMTQPGDTLNGFYRVANYSGSIGINTKLYGSYKPLFMKSKAIEIRHVFTPQVSFTGAPAFGQYYESYVDADGETKYYSPFDGQQFGVAPREQQGSINFSVSNNIEAKYRNKNDSLQKFPFSIDDFTTGLSYNMAAKEKPWSDMSVGLRLKFGKAYTLNLNTSLATYAYEFDQNGNVRVGNRTEWSYGRLGRFSGYSNSFSYTLNNDTWKKLFGSKEEREEAKRKAAAKKSGPEDDEYEEDLEDPTNPVPKKVEKVKAGADGYQPFKMPWSVSISYQVGFSEDRTKPINVHSMRYPYSINNNTVSLSGNLKISNRWSFNFTSGYDFIAKKIPMTMCTVSRDLHCFNMSASISPFGQYKYYNFTIRANASVLQDLKWEQRSQTQSNIQWY